MKKGYEKRFNPGDIVYWCHQRGHTYTVHYGMVDEQFSDRVYIDYLSMRERRKINGIPIGEYNNVEQRYKKLPKGWTYNTQLHEITYEDMTDDEKKFILDIRNPESIKEAFGKGYLVKDNTIFHGIIEDEITKEGYRTLKKYPMYIYHADHATIRPDKVYFTYEEAAKEVENNKAEFYRQAGLSDYDWSVEQIDKTLNKWKTFHDISDEELKRYRDWILELENLEDVEVRIYQGHLQWKYWNKKRWMFIEP